MGLVYMDRATNIYIRYLFLVLFQLYQWPGLPTYDPYVSFTVIAAGSIY